MAQPDARLPPYCETTPVAPGQRVGRILVLDDEAEIRNMLQRFLTAQGFQVRTVKNSAQLDTQLERHPYDLLLLDLMLQGENGLAVCNRLRGEGQTIPILMLTGRGDPADRVIGLETGADDYLAKPFEPSELVARIRAILRRQGIYERQATGLAPPTLAGTADTLRFGPFRFDMRSQSLWCSDQAIDVNSAELRLLTALASTPNRPISRSNLLERARGRDYEANSRSIDVQVLRLRQLLETDVASPRYIRTVWGVGYMLIAEVVT
jgi:two-component system phosphate regulon response regulator OmpR